MTKETQPFDAETERIAVTLLRHLEWEPEGFSIVFLFADVGPAMWIADWLDERLRLSGRPVHRLEQPDRFAKEPGRLVERLVAGEGNAPGAAWLSLQRYPVDEAWNRARRVFLARLNERRFLLERDFKRPLVIVLPVAFKAEARSAAPDLWHIRVFSGQLRNLAAPSAPSSALSMVATNDSSSSPDVAQELPAYDEYQLVLKTNGPEGFFLPTAWKAVNELAASGRLGMAMEVAEAAEKVARRRSQGPFNAGEKSSEESQALRELSVALDFVGEAAQAQGDWKEAETAYRESLSIRRQLVERLRSTPESLRDVSVSLNNVGKAAQAQGDWKEAERVYRESLSLSRQLVERLGSTPESLRDVSVSLDNVGEAAQAQGDWKEAQTAYRESLSIRRQLVERLGSTPQSLRDVSVSLDNVGKAAQAQGDWKEAETAYRESLSIRRQLVERLGSTPQSLRDVSVSLNNVGKAAQAQGDWKEAERVYRESLSLSRQLVERLGSTPESLRDVSVSLDNVGKAAQAQGDWKEAERVYRESLSLSRQLVERLRSTPQSLDDVGLSLMNVSQVSNSERLTLLNDALNIYQELASKFPSVESYTRRLTLVQSRIAAAEAPAVVQSEATRNAS